MSSKKDSQPTEDLAAPAWKRWLNDVLSGGMQPGALDPLSLIRVRGINVAMITMVAIAMPFLFQYASLEMWHMVSALLFCVFGSLGNIWFIRRYRQPVAAGYIGCTLLFGLLLASNITSGGFYDPNFAWLYVVPMAGALLVHARASWILTGLVLLTTIVFWLLPRFGVTLVNIIAVEDQANQALANRLSAIFAIGVITSLFVQQQQVVERGMRGAILDLKKESERTQVRADELERANVELDRFTYVTSHDLRAPLRGIATLSEFIAEDIRGVDGVATEVHGNVSLLRKRVERLDQLLMSLLEYTRIGRTTFDDEDVDVGVLIQTVVESLAIPEGFDVTIGETMPAIVTAREPLVKVFRYLIGNAIKHHDAPVGRVTVTCEPTAEFAVCGVRDDGPGIPQEFQEKVFKIFTTLKRRDELEGSGMGLALVRKIVESIGGRLELESEGRGCAFILSWPRGAG